MRSKLTQCYDYRQLAVPEELKKWRFPESQIDEELEALARDHSSEQQMEGPVKDGHSVQCTCLKDEKGNWEGRTVLLYPGRSLPGAQEAEQAVLGKRQGETFSCQLKARTLVLKVEKVVEKRTLTVGDTLVGLLGLPGVETVEDYRRWYHEKHDQAYRDKASIRICQFWRAPSMWTRQRRRPGAITRPRPATTPWRRQVWTRGNSRTAHPSQRRRL